MCNRTLVIISGAVSLIAALILSFESYLTIHGKSLCSTAACAIVSRYLTINETVLISFGAGFFWFLTTLFFFVRRYPCKIVNITYLILIIALAVDGALIGFQYFTIQQKCVLCISVAVTLLIISICYCLAYKSYLLLFCCIFVWSGSFLANGIMQMPAPLAAGKQMVFYKNRSESEPQQKQLIKTFIFSMDCPHCLEIISRLGETNIKNETWQFASIDRDDSSLRKLSKFLADAPKSDNPFRLLQQIKKETITTYEISTLVKESSQHTLNFLSNLGISNIPVLIIDDSKGEISIFLGASNILQALVTYR